MGKTAIIYGSTTGTTEDIAGRIASKLNIAQGDIYEISKVTADTVAGYDTLLLGSSTWGSGDLQDDWYDGIETLKGADLAGKKIALFGCGDSSSYSDTFCSALGTIYNDLKDSGATFVGSVDPSDYTFDGSDAVVDGQFVGLPIDEVNESDKTDERISNWVASL
ncbi:flavodoxin [Tannerella sp. oral taxon BU063 isolate Cell 6/7/9]|jgi:flavodoxin|uniref:Flavodoxin n=1 Tax=Tannerella sp. oral taxon BU063 isolate Cell 6/7/9 TaxID=1411021 RepID=W2CU04_9BACT|nr:flavodoxin FldA [Tannerella serpentiformis]AOH40267.1 flavodoxin FldA [Tannerella serpentiformis]AVV54172.1 flavodoxin FldA [Tannerella serpentiformis]ETK10679.1 flavodoxin [Tannerella sp. oral taxon BU063 isolate Cell 6/7/9]RKW63482.1 MAG: flavodoxin FldA [Tannerella sp.]